MAGTGRVRIATGLLFPVLLAGCATTAVTASAPDPVAIQRYTVNTTVLESPEHGPQMCLGGVRTSLPPQCGGPDVVGFDWAEVDDEESANGTTWGSYALTGTWDGERLTLTEPPAAHGSVPRAEGPPELDPTTPCETPAGGWADIDPARAGEEHRSAATNYAYARSDVGAVWLDREALLRDERPDDENYGVLTFSFTGDLAAHEAELRRLYGGPLCVTAAERTIAELEALQGEVHEELEGAAFSSNADAITGTVDVMVTVVDDALVRRLRQVDPDGLVRAYGILRPVP